MAVEKTLAQLVRRERRQKTAGLVGRITALAAWEQVPGCVASLYKAAEPLCRELQAVLPYVSPAPRALFWRPGRLHAQVKMAEETGQVRAALQHVLSGGDEISCGTAPPADEAQWVKLAAPLGLLGKPFTWAGKLTGGPTPLTNALAGSLLGAGLGYSSGWLLEQLFPERYVQRGKLRRNLALAGAAPGLGLGAWQFAKRQGRPDVGLKALWTPLENLPADPNQSAELGNRPGLESPGFEVAAEFRKAAEQFGKLAFAGAGGLRSVPMDAFNQAIWNDVRKGLNGAPYENPYGTKSTWGDNAQELHTPPPVAAAASGLVSGLQSMFGGAELLSPRHFITGLAAAGVDLATANLVGGTLGALGGLTPAAQDKLQDFGLWGGLIRGSMGSLMGN